MLISLHRVGTRSNIQVIGRKVVMNTEKQVYHNKTTRNRKRSFKKDLDADVWVTKDVFYDL